VPKFAANLTMLFTELPFMERFAAAKAAGFDAVEVLFPYDCSASDMRYQLVMNDLTLVLINTPPPNFTGGPRGFAAVPGLGERFRRDFDRVLRYAEVLKPRGVHIMAGPAEGADARTTFIENLTWAATRAPALRLTIEPINRIDMPGYFLDDFDLAAEVLDAVGAPNLHLQIDMYHAHRITGDALGVWARHGHRAAHIQIGGLPDRHEPLASPHLDYPSFFKRLDAEGYRGFVSGEYTPARTTEAGLGWMRS
jgi:hydroxypyruvate isomerase